MALEFRRAFNHREASSSVIRIREVRKLLVLHAEHDEKPEGNIVKRIEGIHVFSMEIRVGC